MAARARRGNVGLWPHSKTHKSLGSPRFSASTASPVDDGHPSRSETFADDGIQDILIAYPPVGRRLQRVIDLSKRIRLRVVLDNAEIADALDDACRRPHAGRLSLGGGVRDRRSETEPGDAAARVIAPVASAPSTPGSRA